MVPIGRVPGKNAYLYYCTRGLLFRITRSAAKIGIGAGAVYVTFENGVWSGGEKSAQAFNTVRANLPATDEYLNKVKGIRLIM